MEKPQEIRLVEEAPLVKREVYDCLTELTDLCTMSMEVAEECHFSLPRGGKNIEGPSARFAEILISCWRNARVDSRILETTHKEVVAEATFLDIERNVAVRKEVRRRLTSQKPDMVTMTQNAASSIASRNAILSGIPKALWLPSYRATLNMQNASPLKDRRERAIKWFEAHGVDEEKLLAKLALGNRSELTADHIQTLNGWRNALNEGSTSTAELFGKEKQKSRAAPSLLDEIHERARIEFCLGPDFDVASATEPTIVEWIQKELDA